MISFHFHSFDCPRLFLFYHKCQHVFVRWLGRGHSNIQVGISMYTFVFITHFWGENQHFPSHPQQNLGGCEGKPGKGSSDIILLCPSRRCATHFDRPQAPTTVQLSLPTPFCLPSNAIYYINSLSKAHPLFSGVEVSLGTHCLCQGISALLVYNKS